MKYIRLTLLLFLLLPILGSISAQKKVSLAPTPPMGWNSWNWFGKEEINEKLIKEVIDAMVSEGLVAAGYNYMVGLGWLEIVCGV